MILAEQGGADVVRFGVGWCDVQPTEGLPPSQWDWSTVDRLIEGAADLDRPNNRYKVIVHLYAAPAWATDPVINDGNTGCPGVPRPEGKPPPVSPPDMSGTAHSDLRLSQWKEFAKQFLLHVTDDNERIQDGPNVGALPINFIRAIEIWNEPNQPRFWGYEDPASASEYRRVHKQAKAG